jgi:hypothetical protein
MIVQNTSAHGTTDISFTVPKTDLATSVETGQGPRRRARGHRGDLRRRRGPGLAHRGRHEVAPGDRRHHVRDPGQRGINIDMISTSTIRTSCIVRTDDVERAVRSLHAAFGLRPRPGPAGPARRHRPGTPLRRDGQGLGPWPQGRAPAPDRAGLTGRPHGGHGRAGPGRCGRTPLSADLSRPTSMGRPRGGARPSPALPDDVTSSWWSATTRRPRALAGPHRRRDKTGTTWRGAGLPHLRPGRLRLRRSTTGPTWERDSARWPASCIPPVRGAS